MMERGSAMVRQGADKAESAATALQRINAAAQDAMARIQDIANASREQSAAAHNIAINVERIARMTEENSAAAAQSEDAARHLETSAGELKREVMRFKV
jgi:methyl-accepting chemotaxis protein